HGAPPRSPTRRSSDLRGEAVVFVDGRYVTQLAEQVDGTVFTGGDLVGEPPHLWLQNHAPKGFRLGIDPWLHTGAEVRRLEKALRSEEHTSELQSRENL